MNSRPLCIGLIPARGGSKGVPGKNLADLGGKPLIAWTVEAARASASLSEVYVSTDDQGIGDAAASFGARFDWLRPPLLANDVAPMLGVVQHFVDAIGLDDEAIVTLLQPTSPFRTAGDIDAAFELMLSSGAASVVSIVACESHPEWALARDGDGRISPFFPKVEKATRRQDMQPAFRPNGALYLARAGSIRSGGAWYGDNAVGYEMPRERSLDIDEPWDLKLARAISDAGQVRTGQHAS